MEFGGGLKVDVFKMAGISKASEISASFKHSEKTTTLVAGSLTSTTLGTTEGKVTSNFINAGLSLQFLPRLGFTAGFQMIDSDYGVTSANTLVGYDAPLMKSKQTQWMIGFDYVVGDNAWLAINYGMVNVSNDYNIANLAGAGRNMPDYYTAAPVVPGALPPTVYKHEFSQSVFEASINVEF